MFKITAEEKKEILRRRFSGTGAGIRDLEESHRRANLNRIDDAFTKQAREFSIAYLEEAYNSLPEVEDMISILNEVEPTDIIADVKLGRKIDKEFMDIVELGQSFVDKFYSFKKKMSKYIR